MKSGDKLGNVVQSKAGYKDKIKMKTGVDARLFVMAIAVVNEDRKDKDFFFDESGIDVSWGRQVVLDDTGEKAQEIWQSLKLREGGNIFFPSPDLIMRLKKAGAISAGSVKERLKNLLDIVINYFKFLAGYYVGLLEGLWENLVGIFEGLVGLVEFVGDLIKQIFIGDLLSYFKDIGQAIKDGIAQWLKDIEELISNFTKLSAYEQGKVIGKIVGYIAAEVLIAVLSGGAVTAVKWAGRAGKFAKIASKLRKFKKIKNKLDSAKGKMPKSKKAEDFLKKKTKKKDVDDIVDKPTKKPGKAASPDAPDRPKKSGDGAKDKSKDKDKDKEDKKKEEERIFQQFKAAVKREIKGERKHGIAYNTLKQAVVKIRRRPRFKKVIINTSIKPGKKYKVMATMKRTGRTRRVTTIGIRPVGDKQLPISIHWYKKGHPPTINLTPKTERWTKSGQTPPTAPGSVSIASQTQIELPPTQKSSFPGLARNIGNGRKAINIGVTPNYLPIVGKGMKRYLSSGLKRKMQGRFRTLLTNYNYNWSGMEADHVQDLGWGGQKVDKVANLWPLSETDNSAGNRTYRQTVHYQENGEPKTATPNDLIGKRFKIRSKS